MCEIEISHMGKNKGNPDLVCENNHIPSPHIEESYKHVCVKFKDFSRTSKRPSKCFPSILEHPNIV